MICYNSLTMASQTHYVPTFTLPGNQPLIGILSKRNGQDVVRYFSEETTADQAITNAATQEALQLAGVWDDLSWEETQRELDLIRHESTPTPPLSL